MFLCEASQSMVGGRSLGNPNYATHMVPLITAVSNTDGPILEMGCGDYSTPLLHAICAASQRPLLTAETDASWMNLFLDLKRSWHQFQHVSDFYDWDNVGNGVYWSVILIDHAPGNRRVVDIRRFRKKADIGGRSKSIFSGFSRCRECWSSRSPARMIAGFSPTSKAASEALSAEWSRPEDGRPRR